MKSSSYGQGMAEYGLLGLLLVLVSIAALYTLGETVSPIFANMMGGSFSQKAASMGSSQGGSGLAAGLPNGGTGKAGAASGVEAALSSATALASQGATSRTQTTGALGSSQQVLANAVTAPQQAGAAQTPAGANSSELSGMITDLANHGHQIGKDIQTAATIKQAQQDNSSILQTVNDDKSKLTQLQTQLGQYIMQNPGALTSAQKLSINTAIINVAVQSSMLSDDVSPGEVAQQIHGASNNICRNGGNIKKCIK